MAQVQVTVTAAGKRQGPWKLADDWLISLLVRELVQQWGLYSGINWQLVPTRTGKPLPEDGTLAKAQIRPGAVMRLEPVRNELLKLFLDKLYDEAQGHVQDKLWDKALAKMQELHEYDPRYPDPRGLQRLAQMGLTPSKIPKSGVSWGLVLGGLAVAGVLATGALAAVGGVAYLLSQPSQQQTQPTVVATPYTGGGGAQPHTGDVQITLEWYTAADLDLHVFDPDGAEIYFSSSQSASGGQLDVDANYPCEDATSSPLENVYWPWGGAPSGYYEVHVGYFAECYGEGPVNYRVTVRVDGQVQGVYDGTISPGEDLMYVTGFNR